MLRVKFVDFWEEHNLYKEITMQLLRKSFGDVAESDTPDFLFYSVFGYEHLKYDCVRIFITGENLIPDFNICDYGIGFAYMDFGDRYLRAPHYLFYEDDYARAKKKHLISDAEIRDKKKFCNFVYSNDKATLDRVRMYELLSAYKRVDSGGRYMNNVGGPVADKYTFQKEYKFSFAFENSSSPGYVTEKLIQAFAAGTVPVYWGDATIAEQFNEKAFINCHAYASLQDAAEQVKRIDADDELFAAYLREPIWKTTEDDLLSLDAYEDFICRIVSQDPEEALRRNNERIGARYQYRHRVMAELYDSHRQKEERAKKSLLKRAARKLSGTRR